MRNYNNLKGAKKPKHITDLRNLVQSSAQAFGDKVLYYYKDTKDSKELRSVTYNQFNLNMNYFGTSLSDLGLSECRIAVIGDSHPAWVTAFLATVNGGGVVVPLDRELEIDQAINFINLSECSAVVYTGAFNRVFTARAAEMPNVRCFIAINPDGEDFSGGNVFSYESLLETGKHDLEAGKTDFIEHKIDMEKMCAILFTSGTTGTSKGVMLCQRNLTAATNSSDLSMNYDDTAVYVSVLPIHHTYELTCAQLGTINLGATTYFNESLKYAMRNFAQYTPNALVLVPLFLETVHKRIWEEIRKKGMEKKVRAAMKMSNALLRTGVDIRHKLFSDITNVFGGKLKSIVVGGAALAPEIVSDFYSFGITVLEGYGITECSPLVAVNRPGHIKFDSVGWPVENCEVKIAKIPGEENGEILVKGDNVMMGYYQNEEATREAFTDDGWFRTGDIGYIDGDGYIMITGRKKNVIIASNGKNVYPEELEERLSKLDYILESVVVGRKKADGGISITAIAVPSSDVLGDFKPEDVSIRLKNDINDINRALPPYKHITDVEIRLEPFEKNASKKIKRYKLK